MYRPSSVFTSDPKKSEARLVEKRRRRKDTVMVSFNRLISCATTPHNNTLEHATAHHCSARYNTRYTTSMTE
jgi:hypothetical protein